MLVWFWDVLIGEGLFSRCRWFGCKKEIILKTEVYDPKRSMKVPAGTRYDLQCKRCGIITIKRNYDVQT